MAWFKRTPAAWIGVFLTVTAGISALYVRDAMAGTRADVQVLQEQQKKADEEIRALKEQAKDTNDKVTAIWKWLAEQRSRP